MKEILMAFYPKWCEKIAMGLKTWEIRKMLPKLKPPFKVYMYMTAGYACYPVMIDGESYNLSNCGGMSVMGEFICDKIVKILNLDTRFMAENKDEALTNSIAIGSCLDYNDMREYLKNKDGYALHISNLVIYSKTKSLREFKIKCKEYDSENPNCEDCEYFIDNNSYERNESDCACNGLKPITRPPQFLYYVEALGVQI